MNGETLEIVTTETTHQPESLIWTNGHGLVSVWERLRDAWLDAKERRSGSKNTRRVYERASSEWVAFCADIGVMPWQATSEHARLWQTHLQERGLSDSTVNQRLAACSSWYSFVINERGLVNGVEVSAFMDRLGRTRSNPFSSATVQRTRVQKYGKARILTPAETNQLLDHLEAKRRTLYGSRNYALLLTYMLTGYRNHEVLAMRWGQIRPHRQTPGAWVYLWQGKGGKTESDPLPDRIYYAITEHLKIANRWQPGEEEHIQNSDYIWQPLTMRGVGNLRNQEAGEPDENRSISGRSAIRILHTALRRAGIADWKGVRIHDLRHTFAHRFREADKDLEKLRARLHHESLATTGIYAREVLDDPIDDWSEQLYRNMRT